MKLAAFLAGFALGAASVLWLIGRSIETAVTHRHVYDFAAWDNVRGHYMTCGCGAIHDEDALPPFDPHLWRERMR